MKSSTEVLRELLDERGVEYEGDEDVTRFFGPDGFEVVMQEDIDGKLDCLTPLYFTPEQAIAATLGAGQATDEWGDGFRAGCDAANKASEESVEHYKAENAKLRELVKQMYPIAKAYLQFGVTLGRIDGMSYDWALQMIELGVEVD